MKPTVLLLSTYPFIEPRHGGQVRLANIKKSFIDNAWDVESIAVYEQDSYSKHCTGKRDIPFPSTSPYNKFRGKDVPLVSDLLSGHYAVADDGGFPSIESNLPDKIDAILVEQPWLWQLAIKIKASPKYREAILIFGSQNIESTLKRDILESYGINDIDDVITEIELLEKKASSEADITIAVTQVELDTLLSYGAKKLILAPNGIASITPLENTIQHWKQKLPTEPWLLYIASAHPPNFTGFTKCVGEGLGGIPPTHKLVVAGSVCEHLINHLLASKWSSLNLSRMEFIGVLSDDDLAAVKALAHAYILPIPHGGGSNIKTAEALFSNAYVIGTPAAFRGYEDFSSSPEVFIAKSPKEFQAAIRSVVSLPPFVNTENNETKESLLWKNRLKIIPSTVSTALANKENT